MKKIAYKLAIAIMFMVAGATLFSCQGNRHDVQQLADEINSPVFRARQANTGLFDDTQAVIEGKQLVIRLLCRPFVNLAGIDHTSLSQLEEATVEEFRAMLIDDKVREGLEAMRAEEMTLLLSWEDVNGNKLTISVNPATILE